jgi:replicative DNA helicase
MTGEFQEEVLRYLMQDKAAKRYITQMDNECFENPQDKVLFDLLQGYVTKFSVQPTRVSMQEWFRTHTGKADIAPDVERALSRRIDKLYNPITHETQLVKHSIIEYAQRLQTKALFLDNVDKVKEGDAEFFKTIHRKMSKIISLDKDDEDEKNKGGFLLKDFENWELKLEQGHPTDFQALNGMTAAGGFLCPQLVILMGAPKAFKTGVSLTLAMGYVRDGLNVYYADTENGLQSIRMRSMQKMLETGRNNLYGMRKEMEQAVTTYGRMGGDMVIDFYPARSKTLNDVDDNLTALYEDFGWKPDVIVYDYLDLFEPANSYIKEMRHKIQASYHHAVRLNNKWGCFALSVSPVNRNAVSKTVIDMADFGEDFAKAYNCHAAFALCRTEDEVKVGVARLVPVAQREGTAYKGAATTCYLLLDEARMIVEEITKTEYDKLMQLVASSAPKTLRNRKRLTDD